MIRRAPAVEPAQRRRRWGLAAKLALGFALLAWVARRVDLDAVRVRLGDLAIWPIAATVPVYVVGILFHLWRWRSVLASRAIDLPKREATRLILAANFLNLFLPGNLGNDVYRVFGSRRVAASLLQSTGIVVLERYCGFLSTFLMALTALFASDFGSRQPRIAALVLALLALFLIPVPLAASPRLARAAERTLDRTGLPSLARVAARVASAVRSFAGDPALIGHLIGLSVAMKLCVAVILYLLARALGLAIGWYDLLVYLPIHTVVSALPVSLNGLGVREATLVGFFTLVGLSGEQAASLALLHLLWLYAIALLGGFLLLWRPADERRPPS